MSVSGAEVRDAIVRLFAEMREKATLQPGVPFVTLNPVVTLRKLGLSDEQIREFRRRLAA